MGRSAYYALLLSIHYILNTFVYFLFLKYFLQCSIDTFSQVKYLNTSFISRPIQQDGLPSLTRVQYQVFPQNDTVLILHMTCCLITIISSYDLKIKVATRMRKRLRKHNTTTCVLTQLL